MDKKIDIESRLPKILESLAKEIHLDNSILKEWSENYFKHSKVRYKTELNFFTSELSKSSQILEIGVLPCQMNYILKSLDFNVEGVDLFPDRMNDFIHRNRLKVTKVDIEKEPLPYEDNSFDIVLLAEVFEHLRINPINTLKDIFRVLNPNGVLFLATPNFYSLKNILSILKGKGYGNPYLEYNKLNTIGHMGHVREYSMNQVNDFLKETGFKTIKHSKVSYGNYYRPKIVGNILCSFFPFVNSHQLFLAKKI